MNAYQEEFIKNSGNIENGLPPLYGYVNPNKKHKKPKLPKKKKVNIYPLVLNEEENQLYDSINLLIIKPKCIEYSKIYSVFTSSEFNDEPIYVNDSIDLNIEHVYPQSKFKGIPTLKNDMHHLFLCNKKVNSTRSNKTFEQIKGINNGLYRTNNSLFNPPIKYKGRVARAIAYVLTLYPELIERNDVISYDTIVIWNMISPVTDYERERNNKIELIQGNRNPYIDYPELINQIWGNHEITMLVNDEIINYPMK